jgi:hypothetical protein
LRIPRRIWADDMTEAAKAAAGGDA